MRNFNLALTWYATTLCTLVFALVLLLQLSFPHKVAEANSTKYQMYRALPAFLETVSPQQVEITKLDARVLLVQTMFKENNAPLANYANEFVSAADKYGLDFRLMPAISMQESNGGKVIPNNSYNPFGYGVYGGKVLKFSSFEEAINTVAAGLKKNYIDTGLKTPWQIMPKYTPPAVEKGGSWAIGVSAFMDQLQ